VGTAQRFALAGQHGLSLVLVRFVNLHAAKTQLSRLVDAAASGEEIVIAKAGKPMVRLVPVVGQRRRRTFGSMKGKVRFGATFDAPLPSEVARAFGIEQ
jgi:prevent-host-death family protein